VAAAAIARHWLRREYGIEVQAWVESLGGINAQISEELLSAEAIEVSPLRCPDPQASARMETLIQEVREEGDTLGGIIGARALKVPPGWGTPVFDRLEAELGRACLSLPACKGFELGSGFAGTALRGSENNDPFELREGRLAQRSNHAGGILGGISTGAEIRLRCAFKPVSSHSLPQETLNRAGVPCRFQIQGRHDPSVLPRAVPLVEAAILLVLIDQALLTRSLSPEIGSTPQY